MSRLKVKNKTKQMTVERILVLEHNMCLYQSINPIKVEPHFGLFDSLHYCYLFSKARVVVCTVLSRPPHTDSRQ